jgi:hypothetical protein
VLEMFLGIKILIKDNPPTAYLTGYLNIHHVYFCISLAKDEEQE